MGVRTALMMTGSFMGKPPIQHSIIMWHSPPRRGGREEGGRREPDRAKLERRCAERSEAQTGWSERRSVSGKLTTPALRATPPLRGGECLDYRRLKLTSMFRETTKGKPLRMPGRKRHCLRA